MNDQNKANCKLMLGLQQNVRFSGTDPVCLSENNTKV